jgi:hypothetical protein
MCGVQPVIITSETYGVWRNDRSTTQACHSLALIIIKGPHILIEPDIVFKSDSVGWNEIVSEASVRITPKDTVASRSNSIGAIRVPLVLILGHIIETMSTPCRKKGVD